MNRRDLPPREREILREAEAITNRLKATRKRMRKDAKKLRDRALKESSAPNKRQPRDQDDAFMAWLHIDLPCIACLIEGRPEGPGPIEAAHQKLNIAAAGWTKVSGVRAHDRQCVPLCRFHHQDAPNACDKGQRQFWARLGIGDGVAELCADLYAAFKSDQPGLSVIARFADGVRAPFHQPPAKASR